MRRLALGLSVLAALFALPGCYDQVVVPDFESDGRVDVTNDEDELDARTGYPDEDVPIDPDSTAAPTGPAGVAPARAPSSITLTLIGEIEPPVVGGEVLQATSVWATRDDRAIVSYGMVGSQALGGLDFFTRLLNKRPKLSSALAFNDADAYGVFTDGQRAYAATATVDTSFAYPAVLERIRITGDKFRIDPDNMRVPLTSFAATSATSTGSVVYATSGDDGGLFAFDAGDMTLLGEYPLDDARWVALDEDNGRVVVVQGTPGRLAVFAEGEFPGGSMNLLNTFTFPGADVAESKSTVEVAGGKAFVAAGPEGVQVVCLDDGQIIGTVPRPDPASLGLDPSVVVTNAVTVDEDLMFISNGEAGVYAAAGTDSFASLPCSQPMSITTLGRLRFDDLQSANHVSYRNDALFVAAGLGGTKIVDVDLGR
ncbi:MAG: hypothetical protein PVF90_03950 [Gemmatimonadota bacterium]